MKSSRPNYIAACLCSALLALAAAPGTVLAQHAGHFAAETLPNEKAQWQATESYNKDVVLELSKSMLSDTDIHEIGKKFAPNLIQHDPKLLDGRQAMQNWILSLRQQSPALQLSIKHAIADRDQVFIHSHLSSTPDNEFSGLNRYDMYRLDHGQIVEHWAVQAPAPTESESGNSAFSDLYVYAQTPSPLAPHRVEMNRLLAHTLSEEVFGQRNFALLDRMWNINYLQHNPYVGNGRAALADVIQYIAPAGSLYRVVRSMAEGDLTLVCSQNQRKGSDPANEFNGSAVCDIYRVVNFEMVEHWDINQKVAATSVNGHSMFSYLYQPARY